MDTLCHRHTTETTIHLVTKGSLVLILQKEPNAFYVDFVVLSNLLCNDECRNENTNKKSLTKKRNLEMA